MSSAFFVDFPKPTSDFQTPITVTFLKVDKNAVFNKTKRNVIILQYKTDISYTFCKQLHMKNTETSVIFVLMLELKILFLREIYMGGQNLL